MQLHDDWFSMHRKLRLLMVVRVWCASFLFALPRRSRQPPATVRSPALYDDQVLARCRGLSCIRNCFQFHSASVKGHTVISPVPSDVCGFCQRCTRARTVVRGHDNAATVHDTAHRHLQCYCCCCCCCVWLLLLLLPLLVPRLWVLCCCWLPGFPGASLSVGSPWLARQSSVPRWFACRSPAIAISAVDAFLGDPAYDSCHCQVSSAVW